MNEQKRIEGAARLDEAAVHAIADAVAKAVAKAAREAVVAALQGTQSAGKGQDTGEASERLQGRVIGALERAPTYESTFGSAFAVALRSHAMTRSQIARALGNSVRAPDLDAAIRALVAKGAVSEVVAAPVGKLLRNGTRKRIHVVQLARKVA